MKIKNDQWQVGKYDKFPKRNSSQTLNEWKERGLVNSTNAGRTVLLTNKYLCGINV